MFLISLVFACSGGVEESEGLLIIPNARPVQIMERFDRPDVTVDRPKKGWVNVSQGRSFTCGHRADGLVECWWSSRGAGYDPPYIDIPVSNVPAVEISTGNLHVCVLQEDGILRCDGCKDSETYMGLCTPPDVRLHSLRAGDQTQCGLDEDNHINCWSFESAGYANVRDDVPHDVPVKDYDVGAALGCLIDESEHIRCWGEPSIEAIAGVISGAPTSAGWKQVVVGWIKACALDAEGHVTCWGSDAQTPEEHQVPDPGPEEVFVRLEMELQTACGIRADGAVRCWGSDQFGTIRQIPAIKFRSISMSYARMAGLTEDGRILIWGCDDELCDDGRDP